MGRAYSKPVVIQHSAGAGLETNTYIRRIANPDDEFWTEEFLGTGLRWAEKTLHEDVPEDAVDFKTQSEANIFLAGYFFGQDNVSVRVGPAEEVR